ncbi:sulfite exporter TauE/SafE family protein [Sessilibacter corallicola]|uniref:sulfite exporter TauE/SafE family protein n=1 Tax=Sessilibacter corallicola TaxID=2904075 RepID=UPI001E28650F|nr:sulfite exporter TauE/SafE family protein [Sessilibacter corallicola]MCE2028604.1 sulfite exporter TauE/SafE family protein [Sessilibacter corallicola]
MQRFIGYTRDYAFVIFPLLILGFWLSYRGPDWAIENFKIHLSIAITMIFGSFVAGGTALGGGAVAFPVLTKLLSITPITAKLFSLGIQSFGMTAASITIFSRKIPIFSQAAKHTLVGAIPGVLISLIWIADSLPQLMTKTVFSSLLLSFAFILMFLGHHRMKCDDNDIKEMWLFPAIGFLGGVLSGVVGSGVDIILFATLTMLLKKDLKKATATSVVVMAVISVIASGFNFFINKTLTEEVINCIFAAMPIVIVGAPVGAFVCSKLPVSTVFYSLVILIFIESSLTFSELLSHL